ncbi:MAG: hypothetical protein WC506_06000 [Candidatus Micrarchaeia archaeon]
MVLEQALPLLQSGIGAVFTTNFINLGWMGIAVLALMISVFTVALAYIAGEGLSMPSLKAWSKTELYELLLSAMIIGSTGAGLAFLAIVSYGITGSPSIFAPGELYLSQMTSTSTSIYASLLQHEAIIGILSTSGISIYAPEVIISLASFSMVPSAGLSVVSDALITIIDAIGISIVAFIGQKVILQFFKDTMLNFFMPAGIALRAFPISRRLGSSLIALALACYFVYPLSLAFNQAIFENAKPINYEHYQNLIDVCSQDKGDILGSSNSNYDAYMQGISQATTDAENQYYASPPPAQDESLWNTLTSPFKWVYNQAKFAIDAIVTLTKYALQYSFFLVDVRRATAVIYISVIDQITPAMQFLVYAVMSPIISIVITVTAYRSIASSLGGEEEIFGLGKLI